MIYSWYQAHWQALLLLQGGAGDMGVRLWIETPPALHTARCIFACGGRPSGGGSHTAFVAFQFRSYTDC